MSLVEITTFIVRNSYLPFLSWKEICFDFNGFCVKCGSDVKPGQIGFWNTFTHEVYHKQCPNIRKKQLSICIDFELTPDIPTSDSWWSYKWLK